MRINLICIKTKEGNMIRLEIQTDVLQHTRPRGQVKLESMLGSIFFILICIFACGTNTNDRNNNDASVASIFATDFATDQILQPNVAMHIQRNSNFFTLFDLINNIPACEQTVKAAQFTKDIRFVIKKNILEDTTYPDIDTCYCIKTALIWNPSIREQRNNSNFTNSFVNLSPKVSFRLDRQILWNPNLYNNLDISENEEYKTGTLLW
jgi:hypothetical protein